MGMGWGQWCRLWKRVLGVGVGTLCMGRVMCGERVQNIFYKALHINAKCTAILDILISYKF